MAKLPLPIDSYFAAKNLHEAEKAIHCFSKDATVWDNGEDLEITGLDNIRAWVERTSSQYKLSAEVKSFARDGDNYIVKVVVSGDFPGSPYKFDYLFTLEKGLIKTLAIDPIGPVG